MRRIAIALLGLTGCLDALDGACHDNGGEHSVLSAVLDIRDPSSGACETYDVYGVECDPGCSCELPAEPADPKLNWPDCHGACDNLDETACRGTTGCHAAYLQDSATTTFLACWNVPDRGGYEDPIEGQGCTGRIDIDCESRDDCISVLADGAFSACENE